MSENNDKYIDPVQAMLDEKQALDSGRSSAKEGSSTVGNNMQPPHQGIELPNIIPSSQPIGEVGESEADKVEASESSNNPEIALADIFKPKTSEHETDESNIGGSDIDAVKLAVQQRQNEGQALKDEDPHQERGLSTKVYSQSDELSTTDGGQSKEIVGANINQIITEDQLLELNNGPTRIPLGEALIKRGLISEDQLQIALKVQRDSSESVMIGSILVDLGFITESALGELLTSDTDIKQFDPKTYIIDPNLIKQIPKDIAQSYSAVPILLEGDSVFVAITDVYNVLAIDRIQRYFPKRFKMVPVHCSAADLSEIIENYYDYELSIDGILREIEALRSDEGPVFDIEDSTYTNPTVRLIDALLADAIRVGASDIHFEPEDAFVRLRYRVDGKLQQIRSFHRNYWMSIVVRIKIMSDINITETRNPQDGRISMTVLGRKIDFRVATQPTIHGENIVMRILDKAKALLPMPALGFTEENVKKLKIALRSPEGIIVVTGPTGSGKTTTLYSLLSYINKPDINIMTLEDPVEYQLPLIRQANIRAGTGMDFVGGVKSTMRQDPDVIFVGEVRDEETATMALRAAMTGHQVFTSLHTNDAIGAVPRFMDIGVNARMLSGSMIACVAQRLARRLCPECKEEGEPTEDEIKILKLDKENPQKLFHHVGCSKCSLTGYKGRVALSEIILFDDGLNELIANEATRAEMLRYMHKNGFQDMVEDGIMKVISGMLDLDELIRTVNLTNRL